MDTHASFTCCCLLFSCLLLGLLFFFYYLIFFFFFNLTFKVPFNRAPRSLQFSCLWSFASPSFYFLSFLSISLVCFGSSTSISALMLMSFTSIIAKRVIFLNFLFFFLLLSFYFPSTPAQHTCSHTRLPHPPFIGDRRIVCYSFY